MKKRYQKIILSLLAVFLMLTFTASCCLAEGGEQADAPGISGKKPLNFVSSTLEGGGPVQGAKNIPLNPRFKLEFDKNVVNALIWENNRNCFSLLTSEGEKVPIRVTKVDDTVDFSQRQFIFVQPVNPLNPGTSYLLKVSPDLQAKNGYSTLGGTTGDQGLAISFRTIGKAPEKTAPPASQDQSPNQGPDKPNSPSPAVTKAESVKDTPQPSSIAATNDTSPGQNQEKPKTTSEPEKTATPIKTSTWMTILAVILVAGWIAVEILIKRK